jgi:hypothetical protein
MRKLGVALLGFIVGLFAGFLLTEVIARIAVAAGMQIADSLPLALTLGCLTPLLALAGVPAALVFDGRRHRQAGLS